MQVFKRSLKSYQQTFEHHKFIRTIQGHDLLDNGKQPEAVFDRSRVHRVNGADQPDRDDDGQAVKRVDLAVVLDVVNDKVLATQNVETRPGLV